MRLKSQEIIFKEDAAEVRQRMESLIGQEVPITFRYCLGPRPKFIAIDGDFALLQFPHCAVLETVPLRDLVDDSGYWHCS